MSFSKILSAELEGIDARLVEVETDVRSGLHSFSIVGLADKALNEAKERVTAALKNVGVKDPSRENRKITVNLAPADIKKTGSQYDLAVALGYLLATDQIDSDVHLDDFLFLGELSLEGRLRGVSGALNIAKLARVRQIPYVVVPAENAVEAALVEGVEVLPARTLLDVMHHLEGKRPITSQPMTDITEVVSGGSVDFAQVKGNAHAKRALMIAAAGGHHVLMSGPPGTGKTMLASALSSILPPMSREEVIEVTQIYSAAGLLAGKPFVYQRPFRSPHQTASSVAVVGGGTSPKPGEISLAHRGVLFLDEVPEFRRDLLESLRQPLESGKTIISRVKSSLVFPAQFTLIAAMNPCPCGFYGDEEKACQCSVPEILRYQKKMSGPLLDRIDLQIRVPRVSVGDLSRMEVQEKETEVARQKVLSARQRQQARFIKQGYFTNAQMSSQDADNLIALDPESKAFLVSMLDKAGISPRGYYRILKTARTIADLDAQESVTKSHLAEAFSYRVKEQSN